MVQAHARELLNQKEEENSGDIYVSEPLYQATERLFAAISRLERRLPLSTAEQRLEEARRAEQLMTFAHENEALRREREELTDALEQLKHQYDGLKDTAATIHHKLGDSIKKLNQMVGE